MSEDLKSSTDKNWLIKSSTRILGPFTLTDLTAQLKSKQISIIDEVRQPHGRWAYIRENPMFMDIVQAIRDEADEHSEETMTQSIAHHTMTRTDAIVLHDDLTPTPFPTNTDITPPPFRGEPGLKDVTPSQETPFQTPSYTGPAKSYGASSDTRLQEKIRQQSNVLRWALLGATLLVVGVVLFGVFRKDKNKALGYDELMSQAIRYKSLGLYKQSLASYTKAVKIKEPDHESASQMASVLISEDRQTLFGRRILERTLSQEGRSRGEIVDAYLGIAVSYMMDGDLKQAEDTLQRAVGHEPFNISTLLNLAIIQLKKGNYGDSMMSFEAIFRKNPNSVLALFGRALSTLEYSRGHGSTERLPHLIRDIRTMVEKTGYLRQELLLFQVYAQNLLSDVDGINLTTVQFLSQMQGQAADYTHPLQVDWRFTQWDYFEKYCAEIYNRYSSNPEIKALRSVCLSEVNRYSDASKVLQEAIVEAPKDPYVLVTQAGYLYRNSRLPEAGSLLKLPELGNLKIKNILQGSICLAAQDVECTRSAFTRVYQEDKINAMAAYGLAWVKMRTKERTLAYDYIQVGLQAEPNYLPLLELRDQLESD